MFRKEFSIVAIIALVMPVLAAAQSDQSPALTVETELCASVEERMPVGMNDNFSSDISQVCLWSRILGCTDTTVIKHVWFYQGDEVSAIELPVRSSAWRTYSCKTIPSGWSGDWVVKVIDAGGNVLKAIPFKVGGAEANTPAAENIPVESKPEGTSADSGK